MADDWIKWCKGLTNRAEVLAITAILAQRSRSASVTLAQRSRSASVTEESRDSRAESATINNREVAALCMLVWEWADENTIDGCIEGVKHTAIDAVVCVDGFGAAMVSVGWVTENQTGIQFRNWNAHNSRSAKARAQNLRRARLSRSAQRSRSASVAQRARQKRDKNGLETRGILPTEEYLETEGSSGGGQNGHFGPSATQLQESWNRIVVKGQRCEVVSGKRAVHLKNRNRDPYFREHWQAALAKIAESPFCCGDNQRGWVATIDWFLRPDTVLKLIEGFYDGREPAAKGGFLAELYGGK